MKFENNISAVIKAYGNQKLKALNYLGAFIVEEAKKRCPVDTGNLQASITYEIVDNSVIVTATEDYAMYVHEGTWKMAARRFIYDAITQNTHMISNIITINMKS